MLSAALTIASTGTLQGTGTISSDVVFNGSHKPGNCVGTQNITGNVTYADCAVIEIEVDNTNWTHDQINITGSLTIESGSKFKGISLGGPIGDDDNTQIMDIMTYTGALIMNGSVVTGEDFKFDASYLDTAVLNFRVAHVTADNTIYMEVVAVRFNPKSALAHTDRLTLALDNINSAGVTGEMATLIT